MCGRFTLRTPSSLLASWFREVDFPVISPRYNIAPSQPILALRQSAQEKLEAVMLRWGLIPSWAKDTRIGNQLINARSETAATKPAFRRAFKSRRCIILADGFYEWKALSGGKQPFLIHPSDQQRPLFCFAGLWETWSPPKEAIREAVREAHSNRQLGLFNSADEESLDSGNTPQPRPRELVESCTILTTAANDRLAELHDRMPVILNDADLAIWLGSDGQDLNELNDLLRPCPSDWLRFHPVSKLVNKPAAEEAACVAPVKLSQADESEEPS